MWKLRLCKLNHSINVTPRKKESRFKLRLLDPTPYPKNNILPPNATWASPLRAFPEGMIVINIWHSPFYKAGDPESSDGHLISFNPPFRRIIETPWSGSHMISSVHRQSNYAQMSCTQTGKKPSRKDFPLSPSVLSKARLCVSGLKRRFTVNYMCQ